MAKFFIADEVNDSYTADVLPSGALEVASVYTYKYLASGTGHGAVTTVPAYLHSVVVSNTAATGAAVLHICNVADSTVTAMATATTIARIALNSKGSYIFDTLAGTMLSYYITADCDGVTISYQTA